ncbi:hypothetical protein EC973_002353 [Apophysomyces ossiformis]|uniref:Cytochrome P450 n=1 Tax=Apophysomyces ossiformis TaxID=679940 RepID=A0A8H7BIG9_9FUNG|nr:hypothetical protein EC973_002353 [Apophysomyces ossiformis]
MDCLNSPIVVGALLSLCLFILLRYRDEPIYSLPPCAPGKVPILGHLLQFAKPMGVQELFRQWSLMVGPVFSLHLGRKRWIVLNSIDAVQDLIVKRGTIYSSRDLPDVLVNDFMHGAHAGLVKKKIDNYAPILDERRRALVAGMFKASDNVSGKAIELRKLIEHYTMTLILTIAFGNICSFEPGDPQLHEVFEVTEQAASIFGPEQQLCEFFPILTPLFNKREAFLEMKRRHVNFYNQLYDQFCRQSDPEECFVKDVAEKKELTDMQITDLIAVFVGAGSDTTASTLQWMIALLANRPEIQDRAYSEIIEQVGVDRLPNQEDECKLTYLQCILYETLRLRPPAPLSVPHATSEDDMYQGWFIPAKTTVIINLHAIHQDPERYPNPQEFLPERHIDYVNLKLDEANLSLRDRPHLSFSAGRRGCVGIHLAERSLYMAASSLLACFRFETDGWLDDISAKDIRAPTYSPMPHKVRVVPRRNDIEKLFS